jgi:hypothetical protein
MTFFKFLIQGKFRKNVYLSNPLGFVKKYKRRPVILNLSAIFVAHLLTFNGIVNLYVILK